MSAAADQLRGFFKRLAALEPQGESAFLANVEKVLLERDDACERVALLTGLLNASLLFVDEADYEAEDITNVRGYVKSVRAALEEVPR